MRQQSSPVTAHHEVPARPHTGTSPPGTRGDPATQAQGALPSPLSHPADRLLQGKPVSPAQGGAAVTYHLEERGTGTPGQGSQPESVRAETLTLLPHDPVRPGALPADVHARERASPVRLARSSPAVDSPEPPEKPHRSSYPRQPLASSERDSFSTAAVESSPVPGSSFLPSAAGAGDGPDTPLFATNAFACHRVQAPPQSYRQGGGPVCGAAGNYGNTQQCFAERRNRDFAEGERFDKDRTRQRFGGRRKHGSNAKEDEEGGVMFSEGQRPFNNTAQSASDSDEPAELPTTSPTRHSQGQSPQSEKEKTQPLPGEAPDIPSRQEKEPVRGTSQTGTDSSCSLENGPGREKREGEGSSSGGDRRSGGGSEAATPHVQSSQERPSSSLRPTPPATQEAHSKESGPSPARAPPCRQRQTDRQVSSLQTDRDEGDEQTYDSFTASSDPAASPDPPQDAPQEERPDFSLHAHCSSSLDPQGHRAPIRLKIRGLAAHNAETRRVGSPVRRRPVSACGQESQSAVHSTTTFPYSPDKSQRAYVASSPTQRQDINSLSAKTSKRNGTSREKKRKRRDKHTSAAKAGGESTQVCASQTRGERGEERVQLTGSPPQGDRSTQTILSRPADSTTAQPPPTGRRGGRTGEGDREGEDGQTRERQYKKEGEGGRGENQPSENLSRDSVFVPLASGSVPPTLDGHHGNTRDEIVNSTGTNVQWKIWFEASLPSSPHMSDVTEICSLKDTKEHINKGIPDVQQTESNRYVNSSQNDSKIKQEIHDEDEEMSTQDHNSRNTWTCKTESCERGSPSAVSRMSSDRQSQGSPSALSRMSSDRQSQGSPSALSRMSSDRQSQDEVVARDGKHSLPGTPKDKQGVSRRKQKTPRQLQSNRQHHLLQDHDSIEPAHDHPAACDGSFAHVTSDAQSQTCLARKCVHILSRPDIRQASFNHTDRASVNPTDQDSFNPTDQASSTDTSSLSKQTPLQPCPDPASGNKRAKPLHNDDWDVAIVSPNTSSTRAQERTALGQASPPGQCPAQHTRLPLTLTLTEHQRFLLTSEDLPELYCQDLDEQTTKTAATETVTPNDICVSKTEEYRGSQISAPVVSSNKRMLTESERLDEKSPFLVADHPLLQSRQRLLSLLERRLESPVSNCRSPSSCKLKAVHTNLKAATTKSPRLGKNEYNGVSGDDASFSRWLQSLSRKEEDSPTGRKSPASPNETAVRISQVHLQTSSTPTNTSAHGCQDYLSLATADSGEAANYTGMRKEEEVTLSPSIIHGSVRKTLALNNCKTKQGHTNQRKRKNKLQTGLQESQHSPGCEQPLFTGTSSHAEEGLKQPQIGTESIRQLLNNPPLQSVSSALSDKKQRRNKGREAEHASQDSPKEGQSWSAGTQQSANGAHSSLSANGAHSSLSANVAHSSLSANCAHSSLSVNGAHNSLHLFQQSSSPSSLPAIRIPYIPIPVYSPRFPGVIPAVTAGQPHCPSPLSVVAPGCAGLGPPPHYIPIVPKIPVLVSGAHNAFLKQTGVASSPWSTPASSSSAAGATSTTLTSTTLTQALRGGYPTVRHVLPRVSVPLGARCGPVVHATVSQLGVVPNQLFQAGAGGIPVVFFLPRFNQDLSQAQPKVEPMTTLTTTETVPASATETVAAKAMESVPSAVATSTIVSVTDTKEVKVNITTAAFPQPTAASNHQDSNLAEDIKSGWYVATPTERETAIPQSLTATERLQDSVTRTQSQREGNVSSSQSKQERKASSHLESQHSITAQSVHETKLFSPESKRQEQSGSPKFEEEGKAASATSETEDKSFSSQSKQDRKRFSWNHSTAKKPRVEEKPTSPLIHKSSRKRTASIRYDFQSDLDLSDVSEFADDTPVTSDDEWKPGNVEALLSSDGEDEERPKILGDLDALYNSLRPRGTQTPSPEKAQSKRGKTKKKTKAVGIRTSGNSAVLPRDPSSKVKVTSATTSCVVQDPHHTASPSSTAEGSTDTERVRAPKADNDEESCEEEEDSSTTSTQDSATATATSTKRPGPRRRRAPYTKDELTCLICSKTFVNIYRLKRHVASHGNARPYKCEVCEKAFKQSGHRNEHRLTHNTAKRSFLCNVCGVVISSRSSFRYHILSHRQLGAGVVDTASCEISCTDGRTLREEKSDPGNESVPVSFMDGVTVAAYDCPHCLDRFATAQSLNCHLETHQEVESRCHVQPFTCFECGRSFTYRHNLEKHRECHESSETRADNYRRKVKDAIDAGKPHYVCDACGKVYLRKETLSKHIKTHLGLKPFACDVCDKTFTQKVHLTVHSRLHTGSRPFQCRSCRCCFLDSTALARHVERDVCKCDALGFRVGKRGRKPFHARLVDSRKAAAKKKKGGRRGRGRGRGRGRKIPK